MVKAVFIGIFVVIVYFGFIYLALIKPTPMSKLDEVIENGELDSVKRILSSDIDLNHSEKLGIKLLIAATAYNRIQIVEFLIQQGIDVNRKAGRHNSTPLMAAARRG